MTALTKDRPGCGRQILTGRDRCIRCEVNKTSRLVLGVATAAVLTAAVPAPAAPIEAASSAKQRPPGCRHPARPPADCARKHARLDRLGYPKCRRWRCVHRVYRERRPIRLQWKRAADAYGQGLLAARMNCESGSSGGYGLSTTGNGYWFAFQFNSGAWTGSGGRYLGRPVGRWTTQPSVKEQKYRAVVWDGIHGGDPWPNCP